MNSSNSFNICPRCGNSNSLNAKYCSRCGSQLKVPTEAVVCHKCHTRNSSLANFCRNCGATLKVGAQTKICPRCGREIGAEENICACGYSFVNMQQTEPKRADVSSTNKDKKRDKKNNKGKSDVAVIGDNTSVQEKSKPKKQGRGIAIFAFILLALFVVALILPASARGPLAAFDQGLYHPVDGSELDRNIYGWDIINDIIRLFSDDAKAAMADGAFNYIANVHFGSTSSFITAVLFVLFILTAFFHLLVCLARMIAPKRSKHANYLYLALGILTLILTLMMKFASLIPNEDNGFRQFFAPAYNGYACDYGWLLFLIPVYYLFFALYSALAKKKSPKKSKSNA